MLTRRTFCLAMCATFLVIGVSPAVFAADKGDVNGSWKWTNAGRGGAQGRDVTLKLKHDGDKLTGTVTGLGSESIDIKDGKFKDNEVSFSVTRKGRNGQERTSKYHGKLDGDTIKGKVETEGNNGQSRERDWEAKRSKD